jgi:hypothetical protein
VVALRARVVPPAVDVDDPSATGHAYPILAASVRAGRTPARNPGPVEGALHADPVPAPPTLLPELRRVVHLRNHIATDCPHMAGHVTRVSRLVWVVGSLVAAAGRHRNGVRLRPRSVRAGPWKLARLPACQDCRGGVISGLGHARHEPDEEAEEEGRGHSTFPDHLLAPFAPLVRIGGGRPARRRVAGPGHGGPRHMVTPAAARAAGGMVFLGSTCSRTSCRPACPSRRTARPRSSRCGGSSPTNSIHNEPRAGDLLAHGASAATLSGDRTCHARHEHGRGYKDDHRPQPEQQCSHRDPWLSVPHPCQLMMKHRP